MEKSKSIIVATIILSFALLICTVVYSDSLFKIQNLNNTLSVTGSATKTVQSDLAKLNSSFSRTVSATQLKTGYAQMSSDQALVEQFLLANGITEDEYEIYPVSMYEQYDYNKEPGAVSNYNLSQQVIVSSKDIDKIKTLSNQTEELINQGVIYQSNSPEYYYTALKDERVNLLPAAVKDAQNRATAIAESTGKSLGDLTSASMGVVQVMQPNSVDVSSYGTYDTMTIEKEVMITVRTDFVLK